MSVHLMNYIKLIDMMLKLKEELGHGTSLHTYQAMETLLLIFVLFYGVLY